jgi:hypothetical protein
MATRLIGIMLNFHHHKIALPIRKNFHTLNGE